MRNMLIAYAAAFVIMGGLDFVWLSLTVDPIYHRAMGSVLAEKANMSAAAAFYVIYVLGVVVFAIMPAVADGDWQGAVLRGALFGFVAYATYDLTNLATLRVWSLRVSLIDMAWGSLVTAMVAGGSTAIVLALKK